MNRDADLADRSGPEYAWMDRVVDRARANGTPLDRQQLGRLMADLTEVVAEALSRRCTVNVFGVVLYPDGRAELANDQ